VGAGDLRYRGFVFGLGGWEIAVLGLALLVFFGPHKLPQLMKQAGKIMREVRKASYEFQNSLERELEDDPYRKAHRRDKKLKEKADALGVTPEQLKAELAGDPPTPPAAEPVVETAAPAPEHTNGANGVPPSAPEPAPASSGNDEPKTGMG